MASDPENIEQSDPEILSRSKTDQPQSSESPRFHAVALFKNWISRIYGRIILFCLLVVLFLGIFYKSGLRERSYWGSPYFYEDFESAGWKKNWILSSNQWIVTNGHLRALEKKAQTESIFFNQQLSGPVAIEFDCLVHKTYSNEDLTGDLSVVWSEGHDIANWGTYTILQLGAYKNQISLITQFQTEKYSSRTILCTNDFIVEDGRIYHIRAEIDGSHMQIFCDKRKILEATTLFPLTSGHVGLFLGSGFADKRYDNIKIYSRGKSGDLLLTDPGDILFQQKAYDLSAIEYEKISKSPVSRKIKEESIYKMGLSYWLGKHPEEAVKTWGKLTLPDLRLKSGLHELSGEFEKKNHKAVIEGIKHLNEEFPFESTPLLRIFWGQCAVLLPESMCLKSEALGYLGVADFGKNQWSECSSGLYKVLMEFGEYQKIEKEVRRLPYTGVDFLVQMGAYDKAIQYFPRNVPGKKFAYLNQKKFDELRKAMSHDQSAVAEAEFYENGVDSALKKFPEEWIIEMFKDCAEGNQAGVLEKFSKQQTFDIYPFLWMGEANDSSDNSPLNDKTKVFKKYHRAFASYTSIDREKGYQEYMDNCRWISERLILPPWFEQFLTPAFLTLDLGDKNKAIGMLEDFIKDPKNQFIHEQVPWFFFQYILGKIDEKEFISQPRKLGLQARLLLAKGLRAEFEEKKREAFPFYVEYQSLPFHQKIIAVFPQKFVEWRLSCLKPSL